MPFIHDETEIEWPDDDSEPPPPRPDQFVYLPAPQFGGPSEPARFSITSPAVSGEQISPQESGEAGPSAGAPRRGFLSRLFGSRNSAAAQQERRASQEKIWRQRQREHELQTQRLFAAMVPALRAGGARRAYCRYDGGNDEGWTWLDRYESDDGSRIDLTRLSENLFEMNVHDRLREAGFKVHSTGTSKDEKTAELRSFASEVLVNEWACLMLGGSFGAGEYSIYGAFTVDLVECTVVDDPQADPVVQNIQIAT